MLSSLQMVLTVRRNRPVCLEKTWSNEYKIGVRYSALTPSLITKSITKGTSVKHEFFSVKFLYSHLMLDI